MNISIPKGKSTMIILSKNIYSLGTDVTAVVYYIKDTLVTITVYDDAIPMPIPMTPIEKVSPGSILSINMPAELKKQWCETNFRVSILTNELSITHVKMIAQKK